jgi:hypothetical protein
MCVEPDVTFIDPSNLRMVLKKHITLSLTLLEVVLFIGIRNFTASEVE